MTPDERAVDEKRELALQAVKSDLKVPEILMEKALGSGDGKGTAWNRAARRRHVRATGLILHLYAGKSAKKFNYSEWKREVSVVDILSGQDLYWSRTPSATWRSWRWKGRRPLPGERSRRRAVWI